MKVGVIGTGIMGRNHVRVLSTMQEQCQLVGIFDVDTERAAQVSAEFHVPYFRVFDELLRNVDAVCIAAPISEHYNIGLACIQQHKHVLMEKPITETSDQAAQLIEQARHTRTILQVGHIELFNPVIRVLSDILAEEEIIAVDIHRMSPLEPRMMQVDVVKDSMLHDIYLLYHLFGDKVTKMYAAGRVYRGTIQHAIALIQLESGIVAQLTSSFLTEEKVRTTRVLTRKAFIQADLLDKKLVITRATNFFLERIPATYSQQNIIEKVVVPVQEPLRVEIEHFLNCIKNNEEPRVSGDDGHKALAMAEQISQFILNG